MAVLNRRAARRVVVTAAVWLLSLAVIAPLTLFAVLLVAGPHAGLLPHAMEVLILALGWLIVLVCPLLLARKVWRRLAAV